jgi:homoserine kinase type II
MTRVFVLQHVHARQDGTEDVKFIGVYSSREKADAAVARLSHLPGFADARDGFHVDEYHVDQDQWAEGYAVVGGA